MPHADEPVLLALAVVMSPELAKEIWKCPPLGVVMGVVKAPVAMPLSVITGVI